MAFLPSCDSSLEHIGHVGKISVSGYSNRQFKPRLRQYNVSLSKNSHCFFRLNWQMCARRELPHEGYLFSAMNFTAEIILII